MLSLVNGFAASRFTAGGAQWQRAGGPPTPAKAFRLAATPDLSAAVLDYNLGSNTSVLLGWRLQSCGVPFLLYTGRSFLPALPWPTVPIIHKPAPMIRIVSTLVRRSVLGKPPQGIEPVVVCAHGRASSSRNRFRRESVLTPGMFLAPEPFP